MYKAILLRQGKRVICLSKSMKNNSLTAIIALNKGFYCSFLVILHMEG